MMNGNGYRMHHAACAMLIPAIMKAALTSKKYFPIGTTFYVGDIGALKIITAGPSR